jgi:hypothetical protein
MEAVAREDLLGLGDDRTKGALRRKPPPDPTINGLLAASRNIQ